MVFQEIARSTSAVQGFLHDAFSFPTQVADQVWGKILDTEKSGRVWVSTEFEGSRRGRDVGWPFAAGTWTRTLGCRIRQKTQQRSVEANCAM